MTPPIMNAIIKQTWYNTTYNFYLGDFSYTIPGTSIMMSWLKYSGYFWSNIYEQKQPQSCPTRYFFLSDKLRYSIVFLMSQTIYGKSLPQLQSTFPLVFGKLMNSRCFSDSYSLQLIQSHIAQLSGHPCKNTTKSLDDLLPPSMYYKTYGIILTLSKDIIIIGILNRLIVIFNENNWPKFSHISYIFQILFIAYSNYQVKKIIYYLFKHQYIKYLWSFQLSAVLKTQLPPKLLILFKLSVNKFIILCFYYQMVQKYNIHMSKRYQQHKDRKLLQQLYSRLNITWQQRPQSAIKNPILHQTQNNLVSKSIAHKFHNSKKYKLNCWRPNEKKQSQHIFTNSGIINKHSRKRSEPYNFFNIKQNSVQKLQKYQNCSIIISPGIRKSQNTINTSNINLERTQSFNEQNVSSRSRRAMSAHLSSRKRKSSLNQFNSYRKTSLHNTNKNKVQQKFQIKGWDIDFDQFDTNFIQLRANTLYQ